MKNKINKILSLKKKKNYKIKYIPDSTLYSITVPPTERSILEPSGFEKDSKRFKESTGPSENLRVSHQST